MFNTVNTVLQESVKLFELFVLLFLVFLSLRARMIADVSDCRRQKGKISGTMYELKEPLG